MRSGGIAGRPRERRADACSLLALAVFTLLSMPIIDSQRNIGNTVSIMSVYSTTGSQFTEVDGLRLHYKRAGRGPALLLLHGTTSSLEHFDRAAAILQKSFDVIRPTCPASGSQGRGRTATTECGPTPAPWPSS